MYNKLIKSDSKAAYWERKDIGDEVPSLRVDDGEKEEREWKEKYPLVPAKLARVVTQDFAVVETDESSNRGYCPACIKTIAPHQLPGLEIDC